MKKLILLTFIFYIFINDSYSQIDSLVLVAFYNSTNGANWTNNNNWLVENKPVSAWYGVTIENGNVTRLDLQNNNLTGKLPSEIGQLTELKSLMLTDNQINGAIPSQIEGLINLEELALWNNKFTGAIPSEIFNLTNLKILNVGINYFSGTINSNIGQLEQLRTLILTGNTFNGNIPVEIGLLTKLEALHVQNNQLTGEIPNIIGQLSSLGELILGDNKFSGTIPEEIGNLTNLRILNLGNNDFSSRIPSGICDIPSLQSVNFWNNLFDDQSCELMKCLKDRNIYFEGGNEQTQQDGFSLTNGCILPENAKSIQGDSTVCKGQMKILYTIPEIARANYYEWTLPEGFIGESISDSIFVDISSFAISGNIIVKGINSDGEGIHSELFVNVNKLPEPAGIISGEKSVTPGQKSLIYSIDKITDATSYIWELPAGVYGESNTDRISLDFGPNAVSGFITVNGQNDCGDGEMSSLSINVSQPYETDAGISVVESPLMPFKEGPSVVKVSLTNYGNNNLTSTEIYWSVNGVLQNNFQWTGNLAFGESQTGIELGTYDFELGINSALKIWTETPNGVTDFNFTNDTITKYLMPSLCGEYTIGGENPDFQTFSEAIAKLTNEGISCPVIFKVRDGDYPEELEINPIPGSSVTNTVTFKSESGDSTKVLIHNTGQRDQIITIKVNGAKNIIFSKIGVANYTYSNGAFNIDNNAENISILNCSINAVFYGRGIVINNSVRNVNIRNNSIDGTSNGWDAITISNATGIDISGNKIIGFTRTYYGGAGITCYSGNNNLLIKNNYIDCIDNVAVGIEANNDSIYITNNQIKNSSIKLDSGLKLGFCSIQNNKIRTSSTSGIIINSDNVIIANNYITVFGNINFKGIYLNNSNNCKIVFNSINNLNTNIESSCILIDGGNNLDIKNNIFANSGGGYSANLTNISPTIIFDYNNYFSSYNRIGLLSDIAYQNLDSWSEAINGEGNGVNSNPFFINDSILEPHQVLLNNTGFPMQNVLYDIDSTLRNTLYPDIGAKEFSSCSVDAGINSVSSPSLVAEEGQNNLKTILQNHGTDLLSSVTINWQVNGITQNPVEWSGSLGFADTMEVSLGIFTFEPGIIYKLKVWTSLLNDCDNYNDTVKSNIYTKLCGEYTIGGNQPDFETFSDAVSVLNSAGINCPVVFKVREGEYDEQIQLNRISGSSGSNFVTFESEKGDSSKVVMFNQKDDQPTIILNRTGNVNFNKLTIRKAAKYIASEFPWISVLIENLSENITVSNCFIINDLNANGIKIDGGAKNISIIDNYILKATPFDYQSNGIEWKEAGNIFISGNKIQNYNRAIRGESPGLVKVNICNNEISGSRNEGFSIFTHNDSISITNNKISGSPVDLINEGENSYSLVQGNRIISSETTGLIFRNSRGLVSNNYITLLGDKPLHGIEIYSCSNTKIVHNTIQVLNSNVGSSCLLFQTWSDGVEIKNNIFSNPTGGYSVYVLANPASCVWDNNNYFNLNNKIGFINDSTYPSFAEWANVLNGEVNGLNCNPFFLNDSILVPTQSLLFQSGVPIQEVLIDIDSIFRDINNPCIGAKEFSLCELDAGINAITSPLIPVESGIQELKVILQNHGMNTLNSDTIFWEVNEIAQPHFLWNGTLESKNYDTINVGLINLQSGNNQIKVWSSNPNNSVDCNAQNDTVFAIFYPKLCGEYTIGGENPDFQTFNEANNVLKKTGISCPVIFKVRDGIYSEYLEFNEISGSSSINTVTFESENGDSSQVIINVQVDKPSIRFNNAKNIIISKLKIYQNAGNGIQSHNLFFENSSSNIKISNCDLTNPYGGNNIVIWNSDDISIYNCLISPPSGVSGGPAITIAGSKNMYISGNLIQNYSWGAIEVHGDVSNVYFDKNEIKNILFGFSAYQGYDSIFVTNNKFNGARIHFDGHEGVNGRCYIIGNKIITNSIHSGVTLISANGMIANNYITVSGSNAVNGIEMENSDSTSLLFNSINVLSNNYNSSSKCLRINGGKNLKIQNNIFMNNGVGTCVTIDSPAGIVDWDYNDYFSPYNYIGYFNSISYNLLSSWGDVINGDANSIFANPFFTNDTLLVPNQILIKDAAVPISEISYDIDSISREESQVYNLKKLSLYETRLKSIYLDKPDIGAKQFTICDNDAGINHVTSPIIPVPGEEQQVKIILQNQGTDDLNSVRINWQINGSEQPFVNWTGTLKSVQNVELILGNYQFISEAEYFIKVWTSMPNGIIDCDNYNDTTFLYIPGNPLPEAAKSILGLSSVYKGQTQVNYSVPEIANATMYFWSLPEGATGESTTNSILVNFGLSAESGIISVKGYNEFGDGAESYLTIEVNQHCDKIYFNKGWNIYSFSGQPNPAKTETVFQSLVNNNSLLKIQDEQGNSMENWGIFGGWQDNIGDISPTEGYKVKVSFSDSLNLCGTPVEYPFAIELKPGWNIMGYPQTCEFDGQEVVQDLIDNGTLLKVQDELGNSIEDWGIFGGWSNTIGNFIPGEGYKIKVVTDVTLLVNSSYPKSGMILPDFIATKYFKPEYEGNGVDHMNINLVGLPVNLLRAGDELAIFDGTNCVGAITIMPHHLQSQTASIAASATDNHGMKGFVEGDQITLKLWSSKNKQEYILEPEIIKGTGTFVKHETTLASLEKYSTTGLAGVTGKGITEINCYPNPFSEKVTIEINLAKDSQVEVEVLNQLGQKIVQFIQKENLNKGLHYFSWDGTQSNQKRSSAGLYYIKLNIDDVIHYRKIVLNN